MSLSAYTDYRLFEGQLELHDGRIAVVASRFNPTIVDQLLACCLDALQQAGLAQENITVLRVPGAFEIPVTVRRITKLGTYDAVIALGVVIRGETPHFEYIATGCSHGLANIAIAQDVPVIFGVLTADNVQQAQFRASADGKNKGREVAQAAVEMINLFRALDNSKQ